MSGKNLNTFANTATRITELIFRVWRYANVENTKVEMTIYPVSKCLWVKSQMDL